MLINKNSKMDDHEAAAGEKVMIKEEETEMKVDFEEKEVEEEKGHPSSSPNNKGSNIDEADHEGEKVIKEEEAEMKVDFEEEEKPVEEKEHPFSPKYQLKSTCQGHKKPVSSVRYGPFGNLLASACTFLASLTLER